MLRTRTGDPFATEPRDADVKAGRFAGADRRHRPGNGKGREEQREAQAPGHTESMTRLSGP